MSLHSSCRLSAGHYRPTERERGRRGVLATSAVALPIARRKPFPMLNPSSLRSQSFNHTNRMPRERKGCMTSSRKAASPPSSSTPRPSSSIRHRSAMVIGQSRKSSRVHGHSHMPPPAVSLPCAQVRRRMVIALALSAAAGCGGFLFASKLFGRGGDDEEPAVAPVDKVVILAAGLGTRMRKASEQASALSEQQASVAATGVKALIPVESGRPFLDYVLSAIADAGFSQVCLVIGPSHDALRQYYTDVPKKRLTITFAVQNEPKGTADAVAAAQEFCGADRFVMLNSDNMYPVAALKALRAKGGGGSGVAVFTRDAMVRKANITADRIVKFAVVQTSADGFLERIVEKPTEEQIASLPEPVGVSMNCWRFGPEIFEACSNISPSARGELEIPDAVDYSMRVLGVRYRAMTFDEGVLDLSSRDDIAGVQSRLKKAVKINL